MLVLKSSASLLLAGVLACPVMLSAQIEDVQSSIPPGRDAGASGHQGLGVRRGENRPRLNVGSTTRTPSAKARVAGIRRGAQRSEQVLTLDAKRPSSGVRRGARGPAYTPGVLVRRF